MAKIKLIKRLFIFSIICNIEYINAMFLSNFNNFKIWYKRIKYIKLKALSELKIQNSNEFWNKIRLNSCKKYVFAKCT